MDICGGKESYWKLYKKDELKALLKAIESDPNIKSAIKLTMKIREEQAQTNSRVNVERLVQTNKARSFERKYQQEIQRRYDTESELNRVMETFQRILSVEDSELIQARQIVLRLINEIFPNNR